MGGRIQLHANTNGSKVRRTVAEIEQERIGISVAGRDNTVQFLSWLKQQGVELDEGIALADVLVSEERQRYRVVKEGGGYKVEKSCLGECTQLNYYMMEQRKDRECVNISELEEYVKKRIEHAEKRNRVLVVKHGEEPEKNYTYYGGQEQGRWAGNIHAYHNVLEKLDEIRGEKHE